MGNGLLPMAAVEALPVIVSAASANRQPKLCWTPTKAHRAITLDLKRNRLALARASHQCVQQWGRRLSLDVSQPQHCTTVSMGVPWKPAHRPCLRTSLLHVARCDAHHLWILRARKVGEVGWREGRNERGTLP